MTASSDGRPESPLTGISIPTPLFEKIERRITNTEFASVSSYVAYVLREVLADEPVEGEEVYTPEDEERVKQRLRSLGYMD